MAENKGPTVAKKIELFANIGIILAVLAIGFFLLRNYRNKPAPTIAVGAQLSMANANWQSSGKTLVLAVSTTCHYCKESAGFYRQLVAQCKQQHIRTLAVLPEPVSDAAAYLQQEGIVVDEVHQAPLSSLQINGTPTLLLVDSRGVVKDVWIGKLPDDDEKQMLAKIAS